MSGKSLQSVSMLLCSVCCEEHNVSSMCLQAFQTFKKLMREHNRRLLEEVNAKECALLKERWLHEECMQAILTFFQRRGKSKL